jgi:hypothetical protein
MAQWNIRFFSHEISASRALLTESVRILWAEVNQSRALMSAITTSDRPPRFLDVQDMISTFFSICEHSNLPGSIEDFSQEAETRTPKSIP